MINIVDITSNLDKMIPNPRCELNYNKDYELLIATMLSAQSTDKRVNEVTKVLFSKYDIFDLAKLDIEEIIPFIRSVGTYSRKSFYLSIIAKKLVAEFNGTVPNNRELLESLPGVGRKTANVVLANLYGIPTIAVDTHVSRVSFILGLTKENDSVEIKEKKLMKIFKEENWNRINEQLVLFGRYICKSKKPDCLNCSFQKDCKYKK